MAEKEIPQFRNRRHEIFAFQISADTKFSLVDSLIEKTARGMARLPWRGLDDIEVTYEDLRRADELIDQVEREIKEKQQSDPDHTQN